MLINHNDVLVFVDNIDAPVFLFRSNPALADVYLLPGYQGMIELLYRFPIHKYLLSG